MSLTEANTFKQLAVVMGSDSDLKTLKPAVAILDQFQLGMKVLKETKKHTSINRCRLLGAHMEGPFLCESYSGAHNKIVFVNQVLLL